MTTRICGARSGVPLSLSLQSRGPSTAAGSINQYIKREREGVSPGAAGSIHEAAAAAAVKSDKENFPTFKDIIEEQNKHNVVVAKYSVLAKLHEKYIKRAKKYRKNSIEN